MAKKRNGTLKQKPKSFLKKYNFEIKIIFLFTLGVFLLIEDLEIKKYLFLFLKKIIYLIRDYAIQLRDFIIQLVQQFEVSDLVGISIIIYVLFLIGDRWRDKMINRLTSLNHCPKCKGDLHRIKRQWNHKVMSYIYFVKIKYYQCKICDFKGIKIIK